MTLISFMSCASAKPAVNPIKSFFYHFDGTIGGNNCNLTIKGDSVKELTIDDMRYYHDYGEMHDTLDAEFMERLHQLCIKHDILRWDGFDEYDNLVSDGTGFSLRVDYENGSKVRANGMNSFPQGYRDFRRELMELFEPVIKKQADAARLKKIEEGVHGAPTSIMMNFIQKGESGSDKYEVMILREKKRDNNFSVKIRSTSGEFFPVGERMYFTHVPDEQIDWDAFGELIQKYDIIKWYNYEETAEDYNNSEWFQMSWSFEDGHISAMGTKHPENYDAFRSDFLKLLAETIRKTGVKVYK